LTGSIGVLAGKIVVTELLHKLGITDDSAQRGANAAMFSTYEDFSLAGRERLEAFLDAVYAGFKEHVAAGRHLSTNRSRRRPRGGCGRARRQGRRGWFDELGGYECALRLAREAGKLAPDAHSRGCRLSARRGQSRRYTIGSSTPDRDSDSASPAASQSRMADRRDCLGRCDR